LVFLIRGKRNSLLSGSFQWIQQECTYWEDLFWAEASGTMSLDYSLAGDFEFLNAAIKWLF
jgi:hypothetical protein